MKSFRKLGLLTLTTGLSIGIFAPGAGAASLGNEQLSEAQIQLSLAEAVVSKSELIKKFRELFPQFNYLKDSDFHMGSGHHYPDDDTIRYDLSFHKNLKNGKYVNGSIGFIGEKLEIERFNYDPSNAEEALFPAKVTKEKAQNIAQEFLKKFADGSDYQLEPQYFTFFPNHQLLTEPIRYSFSFVRTKNNIPLSDQRIQITVLGNGEINDFYRSTFNQGIPSFDDETKALSKKEIISKMKDDLSIDLYYRIDHDYRTGAKDVKLVYQPSSEMRGVHAITGEWQTLNGFSSKLPARDGLVPITDQAIQPKRANLTLEEAKTFAEKLLKVDSKEIKLRIESIDETKNHNGQEVISIQYMYEYHNGGTGTNLEIDKKTGEIIQYHDLKADVLKEAGDDQKESQAIAKEEALEQAVKYLKNYAPSYLHNYAIPMGEPYYNEARGVYHFSFPRIVNGILVNGDQISVGISANGELLSLNVNHSDIQSWPSVKNVISKEKATTKFFENLNLKLNFFRERTGEKRDHYQLVYTPEYSENPFSYLDASTGEWTSALDNKHQTISHPWAEKELNYLMEAGIIEVKDAKDFQGDEKITKGAALEIVMRSISRFYPEYPPHQKSVNQTFDNIKPEHPLFQAVERAVSLGVLEKEIAFNPDEHLTKEELAVWYIRLLELAEAAKNQGIYQLKFADAKEVTPENIGFVALAHSLGLLTDTNNKFSPKKEITYADLAVSAVQLAHEIFKKGLHYY